MQNQNNYSFANIPVVLTSNYDLVHRECAGYETQRPPQYSIDMRDEKFKCEEDITKLDREYTELGALQWAFCNAAIADDVLLFHSSAVMVDGKAYCFSAPSGTGKSTHARLWREMLGDRVTMINDDKPFLRKEDGKFMVYGSPWRGKHRLGGNFSAPLAGICFLRQSGENSIRTLNEQERLPLLLPQVYRPEGEEGFKNMLRLMVELSEEIPMWQLDCTISREAAELSYKTMTGTTI